MMFWHKIKVLFPVTSKVNPDVDEEPPSEVQQIQMRNLGLLDSLDTEYAYFDIVADPIMKFMAGSYLPKDATNKRSFTIIVFMSGDTVNAVGKPIDLLNEYMEFLKTIPKEVIKE